VGAGGVAPLVLNCHSCFRTTVLQTAEWTSARVPDHWADPARPCRGRSREQQEFEPLG